MTADTHSKTSPAVGGRSWESQAAADALNSLATAVIVASCDQSILYQNVTAQSWLPDGNDLSSVFAKARFMEPFAGWDAVAAQLIECGERVDGQCLLSIPTRALPCFVSFSCTLLRSGESQDATGVVVALTERPVDENIDGKLEVSTRLASLGKLATRVAHELNNPLDGILRYINLAMRSVDEAPGSKLKSYLSESRVGLMRMVQIIGDLLEFSRATDGEFDEMNVNDVIEQAIKATTAAADKNHVIVAADFQSQQMPAACGSRVYQVCCNLIKNAVDAMPGGGRVSITTALINDQVVIRVVDTGPGLPDPPTKVFEPFFTSKKPGEGTGLGLAICKDFIEDMQGSIVAESAVSGGAVFTVTVPLSSFRRPSRLASVQPETGAKA